MADEGDSLHDPWSPPPTGSPSAPDPEAPTEVTPIEPAAASTPIEPGADDVTMAPYEPMSLPEVVPPADVVPVPRRRWPGSAKAIVVILAVLLVATAAGLGYGWWKTNDDKKDLESASNQQGQELSQQLDKANKDLIAAQQQLAAANTKVTDLQGQLTTAQSDANAAKDESAALLALFPLNSQKLQSGMPGTYRTDSVTAAPGGCSLPSCPPVQLTLTIEASGSSLTATDPVLGHLSLGAISGGWTVTGSAPAPFQLACNGAPQPTVFTLTIGATAVALDAKNAPQVTSIGGGMLLSSATVPATTEPASPGCSPGVASYVFGGNRT